MWLMPTAKNRKLIGGIIARYQELLGINIYAYTVLSNHLHLLIRAPRGNADEFAENVNREIARRINWKYGRSGSLWARRYAEQEVLDDEEDLLEAFVYTTLNCTRHGILADSSEWKGLHSYNHSLSEKDRLFSFTHYSELDEYGVPKKTTHALTLTPLPHFESLSQKVRRKKILSLLTERAHLMHEERGEKPYLGQFKIDEQVPGEVPHKMSKSPRPSCYSKCAKRIREYLRSRRELIERYAYASIQFRLGNLLTPFPEHTHRPPLHRRPRLKPFQVMETPAAFPA